MAKKSGKREKKAVEKSDSPARPHILKLRLSAEEIQLLKVAAAIENKVFDCVRVAAVWADGMVFWIMSLGYFSFACPDRSCV